MSDIDLEFGKRYTKGQRIVVVIDGEGAYHLEIGQFIEKENRYTTNFYWYILENSLVFTSEEDFEEWKKTNTININKGNDGYGYNSCAYDFDY